MPVYNKIVIELVVRNKEILCLPLRNCFAISWSCIRVATIQYVDVSIYCLWCITIQGYIVWYKMESKHLFCVAFKRNKWWFFPLRNIKYHLGWPQCTIISLKQATICRYIPIRDISIRLDFVSIHRYRLKAIRYTIYRYIVASLSCIVRLVTFKSCIIPSLQTNIHALYTHLHLHACTILIQHIHLYSDLH